MGNFAATDIIVQDLDHSGIVAEICDEIGLAYLRNVGWMVKIEPISPIP
jgi:hypothetical protein